MGPQEAQAQPESVCAPNLCLCPWPEWCTSDRSIVLRGTLHELSWRFTPVPYVECPSCSKTSYTAAAYNSLELCPHCGAGLPLRRRVVSRLAAKTQRPPAEDKAKSATA